MKLRWVFIFALLVFASFLFSRFHTVYGLPIRQDYIRVGCTSVSSGGWAERKVVWHDYPSDTTASAQANVFRWTGSAWDFKGIDSDSAGPSSYGVSIAWKSVYADPGFYQARGRGWLNGGWPIDMTSTTAECS
jgi:hypothetical protein